MAWIDKEINKAVKHLRQLLTRKQRIMGVSVSPVTVGPAKFNPKPPVPPAPADILTAQFYDLSNPGAAVADSSQYTMGQVFRFMENGSITKLRFWKPVGTATTSRDWAIYAGADNDSTLLWSATNVTDSAAAGNWIEVTVSPALPVVWGESYMVAVRTNSYTSTNGYFNNERRVGPIAGVVSSGRYAVGSTLAKPDQVFGNGTYYVDCVLSYEEGQTYYAAQNHVSESIIPSGYPTSSNTGPTGVLTPASWVRSASDGQVIENLDIFGNVYIAHSGVTIRNCRIIGNVPYHVIQMDGASGGANITVENCYINGMNFAVNGILGEGTYTGNCIVGCQNGINGTGTAEDNYINDMGGGAEPHYDGTETNGGTIVLTHNTILVGTSQTSAVMLNNFFGGLTDCLITDNILAGGGYTCYCDNGHGVGAITNVQFNNNKMLPGIFGYWSLYTSGATHTGNTNLTTGLSVD